MTRLAIVVLNWNQPKLTTNAVNSILKISHPNFSYKVILVDNGSTDNSVSQLEKIYLKNDQVFMIKNTSNLGYVEGNNTGIRYALKHNFDYVLIINNDVLVKSDFLEILLKRANIKPKVDILAPKIYFASGYEFFRDRYTLEQQGKIIWSTGGRIDWANVYGSNIGIDEYDQGQYDQTRSQNIDFLSGCCLFIPKKIFQKIGLFDPKYFMYYEDVDFSLRAKKAGFNLCLVSQAVIWHLNAKSSGTGGPLHDYFITRNRLLFGLRYAPLRSKIALIRESLSLLINPSATYWKKRGIIDFYLGRLSRGSWS